MITESVYGVQCFLTEAGGFVNGFLHAMRGRFLVVSLIFYIFADTKNDGVIMWEMVVEHVLRKNISYYKITHQKVA